MEHAVMFLPGIIAPAAVRYRALVEQLPGARSLLHDLAVYFSRGSRSHPRWKAMQERLATTFPDFSADVAEGLHQLDPAHQAEPDRVGATLSALWERAESRQ